MESRRRRLGRIDSFSRGAAAEPFPGWRLSWGRRGRRGAARGAQAHLPRLPGPRRAQWSPRLAAAPSSRLSSQHRRPRAPDGRRMNESENPAPRRPPAPSPLPRHHHHHQHQLPAAARRGGGRQARGLARGTAAAARGPPTPGLGLSLPGSAPPHMPRAAAASSRLPSAAASAGPRGRPGARLCPPPPAQSGSEPSAAEEGAASRSAPPPA